MAGVGEDYESQPQFPIGVSVDDARGQALLKETLASVGAVLVNGVRDTAHLRAIADGLGPLATPGVGMKANLHEDEIYRVRVRNDGLGLRDVHGNVILSTTADEFPLHTDAYNAVTPPRFVLLRREDNCENDTESVVADGRAALRRVSGDVIAVLTRSIFPSAVGLVAVLTASEAGFDMRFNRVEIERWGLPFSPAEVERAIHEFSSALASVASSFVIVPNQCLVLDNRRICHGRGRVDMRSARILQRVWVD